MTTTKQARELWLQKAITLFARNWSALGVTVPADVQVSCSFPGGGSAHTRIGECWPRSRSAAKVNEVFINPSMDNTAAVLDVLGHELIHAVDDCRSKHRGAFNTISRTVGYSGGKQSKANSVEAHALLACIAADIGPYPHGAIQLTAPKRNPKAGLHKYHCPECADVLYSTVANAERFGPPQCRVCYCEMQSTTRQKQTVKVHQ